MDKANAYRGCLLGLAVGDAMGYPVDCKTWEDISRDYGPAGLRGYDLVNGYADGSSHTQVAAFTANGLLVGLTVGQLQGHMAPFVRYIAMAHREWAMCQKTRRNPGQPRCWVSRVPELRRRCCMDTRMVETLLRDRLGTPEEPGNAYESAAPLCAAVPVGLFFKPERMEAHEVGRLGAEAVALTFGDPASFLPGGALAYIIAGILQEEAPLKHHCNQAALAISAQFGREYPQAEQLRIRIQQAILLSEKPEIAPRDAMASLKCEDGIGILAGAVYACLASMGDFDAAMIIAVNHSGRSAAVGAITGAILGAVMGEENLPEFYMVCLESADTLRTLATDLFRGCPMERSSKLFDDDWDQKYIQGQVAAPGGWCE